MPTSTPRLAVIIGSTRPGRIGEAIAVWFFEHAKAHGGFEVELIDLAEVNLPMFDEPIHPMRQQYTHEHTKQWSATISRFDAFVFVIPEYNHSVNAATKNAVDYLNVEWRHKPFGIVSYGGVSSGARAAAVLSTSLVALKMPNAGFVPVPLLITPVENGHFSGNETLDQGARTLLGDLATLAPHFQSLREG